tara:strand:- start:314 stop:949 length:636 start_codon:yes stop_codon:yes gene_type:complete
VSENFVKICGVNSEDIAIHAINVNADYLGFIFYPDSPRNISFEESSTIIHKIKDKVTTVAVTVNPDDSIIKKIIEIGFSMIQLHGNESLERIREIKSLSSLKIIKSFGIENAVDLEKTNAYVDAVDYLLFDAKPNESELPGGNAKTFNWSSLNGYVSRKEFFLSGGLNIENVETAVNSNLTNFFDVSSGVESSPGVKDKQKISAFIKKIKN